MALTGMAIAAALALAKNELIDKPAADRKRKLSAATAAYSPWTGMKPAEVQEPNALGQMLQYGGAGAAIGSGIKADSADAGLKDSLAGNPAISGGAATNSLGGMDMSEKLGSQAKNFNTTAADSGWGGVAADKAGGKDPAWFFGDNPSPYSQPSLSASVRGQDPYKTLHERGLSEKNPQDYWQINPFKANY